jgi:hypothetical protein
MTDKSSLRFSPLNRIFFVKSLRLKVICVVIVVVKGHKKSNSNFRCMSLWIPSLNPT